MEYPKTTPTSTVTIHLPWITFPAPWPLHYIPLTTVFTPPPACATLFTYMTSDRGFAPTTITDGSPQPTHIGRQINILDTNDKTCLPSGFGQDLWSATFSPGIFCPSGYMTAAEGDKVVTAAWEDGLTFPVGETMVACCPR